MKKRFFNIFLICCLVLFSGCAPIVNAMIDPETQGNSSITVSEPVITYTQYSSIYSAYSTVYITCSTSDATIYYTTNGYEPEQGKWHTTAYSKSFVVSSTTTVKAIAVRKNKSSSVVKRDVTVLAKKSLPSFFVDEVLVTSGSFSMGSTTGESDDKPVHTVTLTNNFYMGKYEVTQELYKAVMGSNPSYGSSGAASGETQKYRPVEKVSWYDAIYFCNKYSMAKNYTPCYTVNNETDPDKWNYTPHNDGSLGTVYCNFSANGYRLPTEAEWEYAAKGGKYKNSYTYSGSDTLSLVAWYSGNSSSKTHAVGEKKANSLGIYDMSGNVLEWCWDMYSSTQYSTDKSGVTDPYGPGAGTYFVLRGGSFYNTASYMYIEKRFYSNSRGNLTGFRVVRTY